jgi:DnaJ-class molecular chaperone
MGFEKNITHLDGRNLHIVRKAVTQPGMLLFLQGTRLSKVTVGFVQVVKGEGMPSFGSKSSKGDLFIEYSVVLPIELTPDMRRSESFEFDQVFSVDRITFSLNTHQLLIILFLFLECSNLYSFFFLKKS